MSAIIIKYYCFNPNSRNFISLIEDDIENKLRKIMLSYSSLEIIYKYKDLEPWRHPEIWTSKIFSKLENDMDSVRIYIISIKNKKGGYIYKSNKNVKEIIKLLNDHAEGSLDRFDSNNKEDARKDKIEVC